MQLSVLRYAGQFKRVEMKLNFGNLQVNCPNNRKKRGKTVLKGINNLGQLTGRSD